MGDAVDEVRSMLTGAADPDRSAAMAAYMKGIAPFLGVTSPVRRAATRDWIRRFETGAGAVDLLAAARALVGEPERELAYVAIDLTARHQRALPESSLLDLRGLALVRPWWDTVDAWSTIIGRVGLRHRSWDREVGGWAADERLWVRRISLVFQVGRLESVDLGLLFAACRANFADRDFFMRKAIGWGLRDAARSYPDEVRAFVAAHEAEMSGLSVREAMKHL